MADKTTGELPAVKVGDLPLAPDVYDDALIPVEMQWSAMHITGAQWKRYAVSAVKDYSDGANRSASAAQGSAERAETAMESIHNALSNLPAGDTLVINDLTTGGTTAALSAEMGKELNQKTVPITRKINGKDLSSDVVLHASDVGASNVNPNLLDNWYFANPVNQRGQTEYVGAGYSIDRWRVVAQYDGDYVTVSADGLGVGTGSAAAFHRIVQPIEDVTSLRGKTVTYSVVIKSVSDYDGARGAFGFFVNGAEFKYKQFSAPGLHSMTITIPEDTNELWCQFGSYKNRGFVIEAAKLELGSTQTLAHQDADGNWVLNEITDYNEELRKCQLYYQKPFGWIAPLVNSEHYIVFKVLLNGRMRIAATASNVTLDATKLFVYDSAVVEGFTFAVHGGNADYLLLRAGKASHGLPAGSAFLIAHDGGIIADANL